MTSMSGSYFTSILPLIFSLIISTFFLLLSTFISLKSTSQLYYSHAPQTQITPPTFVESLTSSNTVPRIAYLISGSKGDGNSLKRTLKALYHPRNYYAVHLDLEASEQERLELVKFVRNEALFVKLGNVKMIVKANLVTYRGVTMVANTLHAASILFKEASDWDWFINLSASDYPLVTQDVNDYQKMKDRNAPFARKFGRSNPVLDKIDAELLGQNADGYVPGLWFSQANSNITKEYSAARNITELRPGPRAERLKRLIDGLLSAKDFQAKQCS